MNKYYEMLSKILVCGKTQQNKKGEIRYLLNQQLSLTPSDLLDIFETHPIARKKLKSELSLFMSGERQTEKYREAGITWWDYCGSILVNSYPTYFEKLPALIDKINREKRNSKNYVLFLALPTQRPTRHHVSVSYSSRSTKATLSSLPISEALTRASDFHPTSTISI